MTIIQEGNNKTTTVFVTGGNRGIGWDIVKQLSGRPNYHVFLGSRSRDKGEAAVLEWKRQRNHQQRQDDDACDGSNISVIQIDLDSAESIGRAVDSLTEQLQGTKLDILIHNAAFITYTFTLPDVRKSIQTNYRGTVAVNEAFSHLLSPSGRIIFVSTAVGKTYLVSPPVASQLLAPDLTLEQLDQCMNSIQKSVEDGSYVRPTNSMGAEAYGLGKLGGTTIYPRIVARRYEFDAARPAAAAAATAAESGGGTDSNDGGSSSVFVASCCPAFGGPDTPVWLATAPRDVLTKYPGGSFWEQRQVTNPCEWDAGMKTLYATTGQFPPGHE